MGLHGQVLVAGGDYRGGFYGKLLEASSMPDRADGAESISNTGSASRIVVVRTGKNCKNNSSQRRRGERVRNISANTQVSKE